MTPKHDENKLSEQVEARLFLQTQKDVDFLIDDPVFLGRWTSRSHFIRCAVIFYVDYLKKKRGKDEL